VGSRSSLVPWVAERSMDPKLLAMGERNLRRLGTGDEGVSEIEAMEKSEKVIR